jgi:hypothetical protein
MLVTQERYALRTYLRHLYLGTKCCARLRDPCGDPGGLDALYGKIKIYCDTGCRSTAFCDFPMNQQRDGRGGGRVLEADLVLALRDFSSMPNKATPALTSHCFGKWLRPPYLQDSAVQFC